MSGEMVLPELRVARTDEGPAVAALVNAAFQVEAFFKRGDRTDAAEIRDLMQPGEFLVLDESHAAGDPGTGLTACVYVRMNGNRGSTVAAVESYFRARGCHAVDIQVVNLREELPPFYERLGYDASGTRPFPDDGSATQPCHFIVMTKRL